MVSTHVDLDQAEWTPGAPFYGPAAVYNGRDIVQLKILSDRRREGGGIAWLAKFSPPPGKLIKVVATALSDEHVFNLEGGRGTKSGAPARASGGYTLNPTGQPHSAFIGTETISLIIYTGEPDEIVSMEVVDAAPGGRPMTGEPVGGLLGHTSFGLFFLDLLYLPEELRGSGMGNRIIVLAEDEARRRDCTAAFVYTVTFQAPDFYERHGYRRFGEIAFPPDGATRIFLSKRLDPNGAWCLERRIFGICSSTIPTKDGTHCNRRYRPELTLGPAVGRTRGSVWRERGPESQIQ